MIAVSNVCALSLGNPRPNRLRSLAPKGHCLHRTTDVRNDGHGTRCRATLARIGDIEREEAQLAVSFTCGLRCRPTRALEESRAKVPRVPLVHMAREYQTELKVCKDFLHLFRVLEEHLDKVAPPRFEWMMKNSDPQYVFDLHIRFVDLLVKLNVHAELVEIVRGHTSPGKDVPDARQSGIEEISAHAEGADVEARQIAAGADPPRPAARLGVEHRRGFELLLAPLNHARSDDCPPQMS